MSNSVLPAVLTLMVGSTRSMAAHCRGVRLLASSLMTCSLKDMEAKPKCQLRAAQFQDVSLV